MYHGRKENQGGTEKRNKEKTRQCRLFKPIKTHLSYVIYSYYLEETNLS